MFHQRCRNVPLAENATLGLGVFQQGDNISERREASPHDIFYRSSPCLPVLLFLQSTYHRVPRQRKTDPRDQMCYFLHFKYNHGRNCYRLLVVETGRFVYSRDVPWHYQKAPWITMVWAPTGSPRDIYVPIPKSVPVAAPSLAPVDA